MSTASDPSAVAPTSAARSVLLALGLSMGAAVSLGITRFAYGLLLPPMRDDLGWSYALAGGMNTANALGYLLGALCTPTLMRRWGAGRLLVAGAVLASVFMAASGFFTGAPALLLQRLLAGVASAWVFVAGGLLAAQLAAKHPAQSGFLLGLYYGGTGLGIVVSALGVPPLLASGAGGPHAWRWAWWGLAGASLIATGLLALTARALPATPAAGAGGPALQSATVPLRRLGWAMAGYLCFGAG